MSQTYSTAGPGDKPRPLRSLLGVWVVLTARGGRIRLDFGTNAPYADEWEFVPALLGKEPVGPWLWAAAQRAPPAPAATVYLALFQLTHDFRPDVAADRDALGARPRPDAARGPAARPAALGRRFFPVSLLHVGHWENFLIGYQIRFTLFLVFASGLVAVCRCGPCAKPPFRSGVLGGVLLILMALTGWADLVSSFRLRRGLPTWR